MLIAVKFVGMSVYSGLYGNMSQKWFTNRPIVGLLPFKISPRIQDYSQIYLLNVISLLLSQTWLLLSLEGTVVTMFSPCFNI
jgi:hypothetical protein